MFNHLVTQQTVHPDVIQMNETQPLYFLRFSIRLQHDSRRSTVASISSTFPSQDLPAEPIVLLLYIYLYLFLSFGRQLYELSPFTSSIYVNGACVTQKFFHLHTPPFFF